MTSPLLLAAALLSAASAGIQNTGSKTQPIKTGSVFRVTGAGNVFSGEVWVDKFIIEKGAKLKIQSTAVATPAPMALLMVHARSVEVKGEIQMTAGSWGQMEVERSVMLSGKFDTGETARIRVNGCPLARWEILPTFRYKGSQPVELYGAPQEKVDAVLKDVAKTYMSCETLMPNRTPIPPGMAGKALAVKPNFNGGRVPQGQVVDHTFIIKNVGTNDLWVGNPRTS